MNIEQCPNPALNLAPFSRWTLRDKAAQCPVSSTLCVFIAHEIIGRSGKPALCIWSVRLLFGRLNSYGHVGRGPWASLAFQYF
jgi:hypothetical protein